MEAPPFHLSQLLFLRDVAEHFGSFGGVMVDEISTERKNSKEAERLLASSSVIIQSTLVIYDRFWMKSLESRIPSFALSHAENDRQSDLSEGSTLTDRQWSKHVTILIRLCVLLTLLGLLVLNSEAQTTSVQPSTNSQAASPRRLNAEQVVRNLRLMDLHRKQALQAYQGTRIYRVKYRGFSGARIAEMTVNMKFHAPATKAFTVQSATGSALIIDKVFKRLLEAEIEAQSTEMQRRTALNEANYEFKLVDYETGPEGANYVLQVKPRRKDKYLYRGRIWVDAVDFAVVRLEARPAKNPSFWTKKANFVQVYKKVSDFWFPASNHSVSSIRLGGGANLSIEYTDYEITDASAVIGLASSLPTP